MRYSRLIAVIGALAVLLVLSGCASDGRTYVSGHAYVGTGYYNGFYDPYPCWGCGGDTIIVNPRPDRPSRPDRPERPPVARPPIARPPIARPPTTLPAGGMGRPRMQMR